MVIPGYKLGREVQAEQLCTTYNALDVEHSKTVIVKVFNEELSRNPAFQDHFRDVTERLVDQPLGNNVQYLDAIVTDKACVIVTNYCPRSALQQEICPEFSEDKVLDIGVQLATSLSQLHDLGIVHGGVELSNISFLESGEVVLETVAPQRTMPANDAPQPVFQNPQDATCIAPEASIGLTASSDFFSLGVVLYELLLGRKPFNTDTMEEMEQQKKAGQYLPLAGELACLKPLFSGLLAPDPKSRIASDKHFISTLDACRTGCTESGHIAPEKQTGKRPLVFATVAAVLVAAAIAFFMMSGEEEAPQQVADEQQVPVVTEKPAPDTKISPQTIDRALELETDKEAAIDLKNEIEQELKTRSDAAIAEQQSAEDEAKREEQARALAANRKAERERAEQKRIAELAEKRRLERARIARAEEAERLAAQQRAMALREAEIVQKLASAEQQLAMAPLSWLALEMAESEYRVLVTMADDDPRVPNLYRRIVDSHLALANRQKGASQLSESMETVDRGLALDAGNPELLALQKEIASAIEKAEEEQNAVPVIGTF